MTQLAIISDAAVRKHMTRKTAYKAVQKSFIAVLDQQSAVFPVVIGTGEPPESMFAVTSGYLAPERLVGMKVGTYWPNNQQHDLANHASTTLLLHPDTGLPMALINANRLNCLRTAAANAVATDLLANPNAKTLLIVGTGHQAKYEIQALCDIRSFESILVWGRNQQRAKQFVANLGEYTSRCKVLHNIQEGTHQADIITTVTTATSPIIQAEWVKPGTHISAMGADKKGKQELSPQLLSIAQLYADLPQQARQIGEFQHLTNPSQKVTALGELIQPNRNNIYRADTVTVFDSSGIALQDISAAYQIYQDAVRSGDVELFNF